MSACAHCQKPLTLDVDFSDDEHEHDHEHDHEMGGCSSSSAAAPAPQTVPDDITLPCQCHFHWECLLDSYQITQCPNCSQNITSTHPEGGLQIIIDMHNEGGLQHGLDILPLLTEEQFLRAYPEDLKPRAFLELCREGDVKSIVDLLKSCNEEEEDDDEEDEEDEEDGEPPLAKKTMDEVLRYQDPIGDMQSGLHAAVAGGSREVAWLLLLLASNYPEMEFPALVFQEAASLGIMREDQTGKVDIRSLRDAQGRTAEQLAVEMDGVWHGWPGSGRLAV